MRKINYSDFGLCSVMEILSFIATIIFVTASGALAPGPLFFAAISHGAKSGARGGLAFSIGHTLVEFPLVVILALGLLIVAREPAVQVSIGVVGGLALLVFGAMQIRDCFKFRFNQPRSSGIASRNPLLVGLTFTGLNPFFILWWLTVGGDLILDSLTIAWLPGVILMYVSHVWMDYAWLTAVAHFARVGTNVVGTKWYRIVMILFGPALICFGLLGLYQAHLSLSTP
ncbi:MAG: LysE type translocator [Candidatus Bathyarchaeota archaeon BA2]|nr:MAG: LysE type translocator [Candidatus Bathyarchaeota archaeon BA2]